MFDTVSKQDWLVVATSLLLIGALTGCNSPTSPDAGPDLGDSVALPGASTLVFQDAARLADHRGKIEQVVRETVVAVNGLMAVNRITILVRAGTSTVIPEIGIGGRADGGTVRLVLDPDSPVLVASLDNELFPLLAHEMHHVARIRAVGYGDDLLGAMVTEGLADRFSMEVAGVDPPLWSVALDADQLATWSARARQQWFDTSYDHNAWFFGGGAIPRWAGYSIGFVIVGDFVAANPGRAASQLFAEPASSFIPPSQRP